MSGFAVTLENLIIVTHAVPPERVRPWVPDNLALDLIKGPEDEDVALVSVACALNRDFRWEGLEEPIFDFHQITYKTYVKNHDEAAEYIFGTFIERGTPLVLGRLGMQNAYPADFDISLAYDHSAQHYGHYYAEALSDEGDTVIEARSGDENAPVVESFIAGQDMARFITGRYSQLFTGIDGALMRTTVEHAEIKPVAGILMAGEFEIWEELGILREEDFDHPCCVYLQPTVEMVVHASI